MDTLLPEELERLSDQDTLTVEEMMALRRRAEAEPGVWGAGRAPAALWGSKPNPDGLYRRAEQSYKAQRVQGPAPATVASMTRPSGMAALTEAFA